MVDIQQEVFLVQKELLDLIIKHLQENKLDVATAKKLAADFLVALPITDQQDLLNKLKNLGDNYQEVKQVYVEELGKVSEQKKERALNQMRDAVREGKIEDAIAMAKSLQK